jgi:hypothetical protein
VVPRSDRICRSLLIALAASVGLVLAVAPVALADANNSANWSGYAAHRRGVKFSKVTARWIQPAASCIPGQRSYSAFWVGLGGYATTSQALEQVGTEVDCAASGAVKSSAWYELVPTPSRPVRLRVRPGDVIDASVTVKGRRVSLALHDQTSRRWFRKTLNARMVDVTSADWIAEAPSVCGIYTPCQTLPLADFGTTRFSRATAQTVRGHAGTISDHSWGWTKISLTPGGRSLVAAERSAAMAGASTPSALAHGGSAFTVTYSRVGLPGAVEAQRASVQEGRLVH